MQKENSVVPKKLKIFDFQSEIQIPKRKINYEIRHVICATFHYTKEIKKRHREHRAEKNSPDSGYSDSLGGVQLESQEMASPPVLSPSKTSSACSSFKSLCNVIHGLCGRFDKAFGSWKENVRIREKISSLEKKLSDALYSNLFETTIYIFIKGKLNDYDDFSETLTN